jgi:hypothetical protein
MSLPNPLPEAEPIGPAAHEIVAVYVAHDEPELLVESIRSLKLYVDRFVIYDSIFFGNPQFVLPSEQRDAAASVLEAEPRRPYTYVSPTHTMPEADARSAAIREVLDGDWILIVDSDEIMYGNHRQLTEFFHEMRSGSLDHHKALNVGVFTTAVNVSKNAPDITPEEYMFSPTLSTFGYMARLIRKTPHLAYVHPPGGRTPMPADNEGPVVATMWMPNDFGILVNDHIRQPLESYKNDFAWESIVPT